jgi:hypothetical protein
MFAQGEAGTEKKMVFSCIIKTKWCATSKISGGDKLGGRSSRGGGKEGEGRNAMREVTKIVWKTGKPPRIFVHPQSFFSVNVNDQNRTLALDHFSPKIRFPTLPAFIDSLTAVLLDPPLGYLHSNLATFMRGYLAELLYFPFQGNNPLKPNGELCKNYASVAKLLREENRPYFVSYLKRHHGQVVWEQEVEIRRAILEKLG